MDQPIIATSSLIRLALKRKAIERVCVWLFYYRELKISLVFMAIVVGVRTMSSMRRGVRGVLWTSILAATATVVTDEARAVGVLYADPGWYHAYDGNSAYYYDPDGPNPDYNNGPVSNLEGGRGDMPALINPGPCADDNACAAAAIWQNKSTQWEGSAPGDPFGGTPYASPDLWNNTKPVVPPPAPGGVGTYTESGTSYLRIQDPGDPLSNGWLEKGNQVSPGKPRQEGNNQKI